MTAAEQDARRETLRSLVACAVEDDADALIEHLAVWLGEDRATDAQVIAFALEDLGRQLRERAAAERSRAHLHRLADAKRHAREQRGKSSGGDGCGCG